MRTPPPRNPRHHWILAMLLLLALLPLPASADTATATNQLTGSLTGQVLDAATRNPIPAANVFAVGTERGTAADVDGRFSLAPLQPGTYTLRASALGYEARVIAELTVTPGRARSVTFLLQPSAVRAEEVVYVQEEDVDTADPDLPTSTRSLRYEEVRRAPGAAEDVQRMLQALPGVAGDSDQNNEIVVRGGSPAENLIVMDGIEVENINHFGYPSSTGGPITALNPEFLQEVTFASGGFSARYGDKLSSVLDLDLREGSRDHYAGTLDFNMAGAGGNIEGPLPGGRGSFLAAAHRSFLELTNQGSIGLTAIPVYWNSQAKVVYDLNDQHQLTLNALYAQDEIHIDDDEEEGGFNRGAEKVDNENQKYVTGARLRSLWGPGYTDLVVARSMTNYTADVFEVDFDGAGNRIARKIVDQDITEFHDQFTLSWNARAREHDEYSIGVGVKPITFDHYLWLEQDTTVFNDGLLGPPDTQPDTLLRAPRIFEENTTGIKTSAFAQYTWRPTSTLSLTGGLRYDGFDYSDQHTLGPRASLSWAFAPRWRLNLATGVYYQSQPLINYTYEEGDANQTLPHARADQYVAGVSYSPRSSTLFSAEGYFKDYDDLLISEQTIVRETTGDFTFRSDVDLPWRTKTAWGVEVFAQQKLVDDWYGTFSYSFGEARTDDPAYGNRPASYDFRHVATAVAGYRISLIQQEWWRNALATPVLGWLLYPLPVNGDEVTLSTRFRMMTGRPYTDRVWYAEGQPSPDPYYESHWANGRYHGSRYPAYQRWDIRIDNKHYFDHMALVFYLEVQNVLDRANIADYAYADDGEVDEVHQFRFFFVGGVRLEL